MDTVALIEDGATGLARIVELLRLRGFPVIAAYLIKLSSEDGSDDWGLRIVVSPARPGLSRDVIYELGTLRREHLLPRIDFGVRIGVVPADDAEALRVVDYARQFDDDTVSVRNTMWKGMYIEQALVVRLSETDRAVA